MNATPLHRRRLLAAACAVIAALALAWGLPRVVATAHAKSPIRYVAATAQANTPIRHVVVIYLENHSFDNILGFWCDQHASRCPGAGMPASVRLSNGARVTPSTTPDVVPQVRHQTGDQAAAIDRGRMDGWWRIPGCSAPAYVCVSGYQPSHIPNVTQLAQTFAISDATFSMQNSPSFFGHLYSIAASTDGFTGNNPSVSSRPGNGWGCDSGKKTTWAAFPGGPLQKVPTCVPDPALSGPRGRPLANGGAAAPTPVGHVPTILDRLNNARLTWRIYGANCTVEAVNAQGLDTCKQSNGQYAWAVCPSFAEYLYTAQCNGKLNAAGDGLVPDNEFTVDARGGNLPAFSLVTAGNFKTSEHNGSSMTAGDNWLGHLVSAAENGPEWRSTAIFITWDDCGCFYDQMSPGSNPDGTKQGPRVPLIIVSPYAKAGYTDTRATTFAGILAYTENTFGLAPLNVNDTRAYPFTNAFNYAQTPLRPATMITRRLPPAARHIHLTPAQLHDPS